LKSVVEIVEAVLLLLIRANAMLPDEKLTATSSFSVKDGKLVEHQPVPRRVSRRHSVGFKPDTEMQQVVVFDMHDEEVREVVWYSRDEYDIIKARNR